MIELEVSIDPSAEEKWAGLDIETISQRAAEALVQLAPHGVKPGIVAALFTDDATMQGLNREWRDKDKPTNVLSFPADPMPEVPGIPLPLGDLALGAEICAREAAEKGIPVENHTCHLIVHGLLHLIGYDHIDDADAQMMEDWERRILASLDIPDPYAGMVT